MSSQVEIFLQDPSAIEKAKALAICLQCPIVTVMNPLVCTLVVTAERLELRYLESEKKGIFIDFNSNSLLERLKHNRGRRELIARAVGVKGNFFPRVVDATAGLGKDAMILAHLGCHVDMVERSPVMWALLNDAWERAQQHPPSFLRNLTLNFTDANDFLQACPESIDVVYLDPMFPIRTKSALVKKEMRVIKGIVGFDEDAAALFEHACKIAMRRVVVKRPLHAPHLTAELPDIVYKGKVCRFDVYLSRREDAPCETAPALLAIRA